MPITVGELLEMPYLRLRLHSGAAALDRTVEWTHTTDLPEPWRWVAGGELLMTNGMPVPRSASGQTELVRQLVDHGAAGLAIGEEMYCPPLTRALARTSDELGFPVLWIAFPMPFVAISRAVAEATLLEQSQRLIRTERIYRALQRVSADETGLHDLTKAFARDLGCPVRICDRDTGEDWAPGADSWSDEIHDAISGRQGRLRAGVIAVVLDEDRRALIIDLPTHPDAVLVALPNPREQIDALLMQHAATVAALALSQARLHIEHRRRAGAELLAQILDGRLAPASAVRQLAEAGVDARSAVVVAARNHDRGELLRDLHLRLWRRNVPHVTLHRADLSLAVLPGGSGTIDAVVSAAGPGAQVGVSNPVGSVSRFAQAQSEAEWALRIAADRGAGFASYDEATPPLGPRTPDEARLLVDRVLGQVLLLPRGQAAELLATLHAFLSHGRSWQRTAEQLHVHRQTVLYRIRKVEDLTGHRVADTADLASLWLALQARALLE